VRHALAELECHATRVVDEEAQRAATDDLGEQHFDVGLGGCEPCLDVGLDAAHLFSFPDNKKAGERPLLTFHRREPAL
jgi:hypothetical protein